MKFKTHGRWKRRLAKRLFKEAKAKCPRCDVQMTRAHGRPNSATLDHIVPASRGGPTTKRNLAIMCRSCNAAKGASAADPGEHPWRNPALDG